MKRKSRIMAALICLIVLSMLFAVSAAAATNYYTITWKNYDGTILERDFSVPNGTRPQYNGATPTKPADDEYEYIFIGWATFSTSSTGSLSLPAVAGNRTYYAIFEKKEINEIGQMNELAFTVYKTIARISVFLAILSFASCGWKMIGSIFFGNYVSMAGTDFMKAQKQIVLTILVLMFIFLLPTLIGSAIDFFENGESNFGLKPWTPQPVS